MRMTALPPNRPPRVDIWRSARRKTLRQLLDGVELVRREGGADHRAHRRSRHHIDENTGIRQGTERPDMRPDESCAPAEGDRDLRTDRVRGHDEAVNRRGD
jgi:hypothetical protein